MNVAVPHPAFEKVDSRRIDALNINLEEYRHSRIGTPHFHLATDNPENVFLVGLRTIPQDSTGVAHILEHTVLCGSEKYPVRDPFFMMIRRSLNTFMNAFTASDWTAYPFASQNRKDYFNLLDVYLDAVFFSRLDPLDFAQEGHRIEFEQPDNPQSDLVYKGVVFNEMKGAMSAPTSVLWQSLSRYLFPNNTYHHNSGGDPEAIPDLSYEELLSFYRTHYHPSNAVFMTYGDLPVAELQTTIDERVLKRFEKLDRHVGVQPTQRFHSTLRVEEAYAVNEDNIDDKAHVVHGWLLGESTDLDYRLRALLLADVLLDNSASPLRMALETTDLGSSPSPICGLEDSSRDMVFVCGLEGTNPDNADAIEALILDTLKQVEKEGVDQQHVDSVLHQLELSQREIRGDGMPFGLQLLLGGLSTAMLRGDTLSALDLDPVLNRLREDSRDPDFIPGLIRTLLLENHHRVRLTLRPDNQLSEKRVIAEKQRLQQIRSKLDEAREQRIVSQAKALAERQTQQDDPDILPKVGLDDVPETLPIAEGEETLINASTGTSSLKAHFYNQGTNGLVYQDLILQLPRLDEELLPLLPYYAAYLNDVGCADKDYLQVQSLQAAITGSLYAYPLLRSHRDDPQRISAHLVFSGKALQRNHQPMSELMAQVLDAARFDETKRLRELVAQSRASQEQSITGSGHALAMRAAASGMSAIAAYSHRMSGLEGIRNLKALDDSLSDEAQLKALSGKLAAIHEQISRAPREMLLIAEDANRSTLVNTVADHLVPQQGKADEGGFVPLSLPAIRESTNEFWAANTEVNFCAASFQTVPSSHPDAPVLAVLGPFLRNGYLHRAIRETGGAYGAGASQDNNTASFSFFSYRDPRLSETLEDFSASIDWLLTTQHDWQPVEEAILNVVSSIDKPGSPAGRARSAFQNELFGRSAEFRREQRKKVLDVKLEDLQRVGENYFNNVQPSRAVLSHSGMSDQADKLGLQLQEL